MKRAFLSVDIEGVAGVSSWEETSPGKSGYEAAARRMTQEVATVCDAFSARGIDELVVKDAHGREARNLDIEAMPENTRVHRGWSGHPAMMMSGLDASCALVGFVGYHSGGGMTGNPLGHSFYGQSRILLNGVPTTEFEINALYAAEMGVPTLFLSGDEEICALAKAWDSRIETVVTGTGDGNASLAEHPAIVRRKLREAAARAVELALQGARPKEPPTSFEVQVRWLSPAHAYWASFFPDVERIDPSTIAFTRPSCFEVLRTLHYTLYPPLVLTR